MNLYQKLMEIQKGVRGLAPNKNASTYNYVAGSKVLDYIRPKMDELGVLLVQQIDSIENERMDYQVKSGAKSEILSKVMMTFTWIDSETGEALPVKFGANGQNSWDKGLGSALTYAERYFLLKFFHIATDEDDVDAIKRDDNPQPVAGWTQPEKFPKPASASVKKKTLVQGSDPWKKAVARIAGGEQGLMEKLRATYVWDDAIEEAFANDVFNFNLDNRDDNGQLKTA